jgi:GTP-binding protein
MKIEAAEYIGSAGSLEGCPKTDLPEFAFIGRSNVGKSSLINFLTERSSLALTSSRPGKTKSINHFLINKSWYLVDLPGYGYAAISQTTREKWLRNTEQYILKRKNLVSVFQLIDASIPPQKADLDFTNWLGNHGVPFAIVFTKTDKAKSGEVNRNIKSYKTKLSDDWEELPVILMSSAEKGIGKKEILAYISECMKSL